MFSKLPKGVKQFFKAVRTKALSPRTTISLSTSSHSSRLLLYVPGGPSARQHPEDRQGGAQEQQQRSYWK
jgi:hypothetical protein